MRGMKRNGKSETCTENDGAGKEGWLTGLGKKTLQS